MRLIGRLMGHRSNLTIFDEVSAEAFACTDCPPPDLTSPTARLARMLSPKDYEFLMAWIGAEGHDQHRWSSGGYRSRMTRAAVTLTACGVTVDAMVTYALWQVMELHGTDLVAENVDDTATAYAVIHTTGVGPASKGMLQTIRSIYR